MGDTLMIGQNCCYWSKDAIKPLAAICTDFEAGSGMANLTVFTPNGGRFSKVVGPKDSRAGEGWAEVGQFFH